MLLGRCWGLGGAEQGAEGSGEWTGEGACHATVPRAPAGRALHVLAGAQLPSLPSPAGASTPSLLHGPHVVAPLQPSRVCFTPSCRQMRSFSLLARALARGTSAGQRSCCRGCCKPGPKRACAACEAWCRLAWLPMTQHRGLPLYGSSILPWSKCAQPRCAPQVGLGRRWRHGTSR